MIQTDTLQHIVDTWVEKNSNGIAIIETETGEQITYRDLASAVSTVRQFLGNEQQTILLAFPGSIIASVIWLAALTGGHHLIPVSPYLTEFEYRKYIEKYQPTFLFSETAFPFKNQNMQSVTLNEIQKSIADGIAVKLSLPKETRDGTLYLETSGSTGTPKGMILSVEQMMITANLIREHHQLTKDSRGLTPLPFYHVNAPIVSLLSTIIAGGTVIIAPKFSASRFWNWVEKYDPTWISIVPTIVAILLKSDNQSFLKNSSVRFVRTASAPLPKVNLIAFEKKFGLPVIETYGISEAASTIASNPLPPKTHKPGSVGLPLGVSMKIINSETGETVSQGKIGEVCVKGAQVIARYEEGRGKESFARGWFHTGDLGYFDEDGYLFLTGRKKELIIRGGENIFPREIEEMLLTYPDIFEAAVVGQPDDILGEKVVAFVVGSNKNTNREDVKEYVKTKLSRQKVPAEIYILDQLPRTRTGKIDKNILRTYTG